MLVLQYRRLWIAVSVALVTGVAWGSLQTAFGTEVPRGFDKIEHFATYLFLAVWFTGLCAREGYWRVAVGLLSLGLAMEVGQFAMAAGRTADASDMLANTAGVMAGISLAWAGTGGWAGKVEGWLR